MSKENVSSSGNEFFFNFGGFLKRFKITHVNDKDQEILHLANLDSGYIRKFIIKKVDESSLFRRRSSQKLNKDEKENKSNRGSKRFKVKKKKNKKEAARKLSTGSLQSIRSVCSFKSNISSISIKSFKSEGGGITRKKKKKPPPPLDIKLGWGSSSESDLESEADEFSSQVSIMTAKDTEEKDDPGFTNPAFVKEDFEDEGVGGLDKEEKDGKDEDKDELMKDRSDGDGSSETESMSSMDSASPTESPKFNLKSSPRPKKKRNRKSDGQNSPVSFRSGYQSNRSSISSARKGILKKSTSSTTINMEMSNLSRPQTPPTEIDDDAYSNGDTPRFVRTQAHNHQRSFNRVKFILDSGKPDNITGDYNDIKMEKIERENRNLGVGVERGGGKTTDDRNNSRLSKSGRKCLIFSAGVLVLTMAVILGSFFGSRKSALAPKALAAAGNNLFNKYIENAAEGRFKITNEKFADYMANQESEEFQKMTTKLETALKEAIFKDEQEKRPNSTSIIKIIRYKKSTEDAEIPVSVFRIKWSSDMNMNIRDIRKNATNHLNKYGTFGEYRVDKSSFSVSALLDSCAANLKNCSHICFLSEISLKFGCTCPESLLLVNATHCQLPKATTSNPVRIGEEINKVLKNSKATFVSLNSETLAKLGAPGDRGTVAGVKQSPDAAEETSKNISAAISDETSNATVDIKHEKSPTGEEEKSKVQVDEDDRSKEVPDLAGVTSGTEGNVPVKQETTAESVVSAGDVKEDNGATDIKSKEKEDVINDQEKGNKTKNEEEKDTSLIINMTMTTKSTDESADDDDSTTIRPAESEDHLTSLSDELSDAEEEENLLEPNSTCQTKGEPDPVQIESTEMLKKAEDEAKVEEPSEVTQPPYNHATSNTTEDADTKNVQKDSEVVIKIVHEEENDTGGNEMHPEDFKKQSMDEMSAVKNNVSSHGNKTFKDDALSLSTPEFNRSKIAATGTEHLVSDHAIFTEMSNKTLTSTETSAITIHESPATDKLLSNKRTIESLRANDNDSVRHVGENIANGTAESPEYVQIALETLPALSDSDKSDSKISVTSSNEEQEENSISKAETATALSSQTLNSSAAGDTNNIINYNVTEKPNISEHVDTKINEVTQSKDDENSTATKTADHLTEENNVTSSSSGSVAEVPGKQIPQEETKMTTEGNINNTLNVLSKNQSHNETVMPDTSSQTVDTEQDDSLKSVSENTSFVTFPVVRNISATLNHSEPVNDILGEDHSMVGDELIKQVTKTKTPSGSPLRETTNNVIVDFILSKNQSTSEKENQTTKSENFDSKLDLLNKSASEYDNLIIFSKATNVSASGNNTEHVNDTVGEGSGKGVDEDTKKQIITLKGIPFVDASPLPFNETSKPNQTTLLETATTTTLTPLIVILSTASTLFNNTESGVTQTNNFQIDFGLIANISHDLSVPVQPSLDSISGTDSPKNASDVIPFLVGQNVSIAKAKGCDKDKFECANGHCIPLHARCDSVYDCVDVSDEKECIENKCMDNYQCRWSGDCLARAFVCDGVKHCSDGDDEENCEAWKCTEDEFRCSKGSSSTCLPPSLKCDGHSDCFNHTDEYNCSTECQKDEFLCPEGNCIPDLWKCDGRSDCLGGEDEVNCGCEGLDQSPCFVGGCVPTFKLCDGLRQCPDGSDEWGCIRIDNDTKLLEVRSSEGRWAAVCGDKWTSQWTDLVCEQLGLGETWNTELRRMTDSVPRPRVKLSQDAPEISRGRRAPLQYFLTTGDCSTLVHISCKTPQCGTWQHSLNEAALHSHPDTKKALLWPSLGLLIQPDTYEDQAMTYKYGCAASIITPVWVLASYSCLSSKTSGLQAEKWALITGDASPRAGAENTKLRYAKQIVVYFGAKRNEGIWQGDAALLRLRTPLTLDSSVQPICLLDEPAESHDQCVIATWQTYHKEGNDVEVWRNQSVQNLPIPNLTSNTCNNSYYDGKLRDGHACASLLQSKNSPCTGLEGSPLMCRKKNGTWFLQGLLSYTGNCATFNLPSVFTDVTTIQSWILKTIGRPIAEDQSSKISITAPKKTPPQRPSADHSNITAVSSSTSSSLVEENGEIRSDRTIERKARQINLKYS